jgi:hypothetical protein
MGFDTQEGYIGTVVLVEEHLLQNFLRVRRAPVTGPEKGWGAVLKVGEAQLTAFEPFPPTYTSTFSKPGETAAVLNALQYFKHVLLGRLVKELSVRTENMVTVFEGRQIFSIL